MATAGEQSEDGLEDLSDDASYPEEWEHAGLEAIDRVCATLYSDQPDPLQATAVVKFWQGGPDPLDFVRIYSNPGDADRNIPPHWHFISCGFSDLYGDRRTHKFKGSDQPSGFGFELTMRLKQNDSSDDTQPPTWPTILMNRLASYVFETENVFQIGDHIPWHKPLDGKPGSIIQHMLLAQDPQLSMVHSGLGYFNFIQIVGVTLEEMKAAQRWRGSGVLELLATSPLVSPYLVTNMARKQCIFEADADMSSKVDAGIRADGSNLGHVTAVCLWGDLNAKLEDIPASPQSEENSATEPVPLEGVHLMFDKEAAGLLAMVIKGRLEKGRFFIFHNAEEHSIHLIPPDCEEHPNTPDTDIFVNQQQPLKALGTYLQIYCSSSLMERLSRDLESLLDTKVKDFPKEIHLSDPSIQITVIARAQQHYEVPEPSS